MRCQWKTEGCHSHLIEADILLAFTFPPSLDTWNQPWFACQMVSISWPVRCIRTTPWWITALIVCQSLTLKCKASQRFLLFFSVYLPSLPHRLFILKAFTVCMEIIHCTVITWNLKCRMYVCVTLFYMNVCQIAFKRVLYSDVLSHSIMRWWEWMW